MDGEHIEMMIHGWASSELRGKAIAELGKMREELCVLRSCAKRPIDSFTTEDIEEMKMRVDDPDWDVSQQEDVRLILEKLVNCLAAARESI
jgi:hypothetical protein